MTEIFAKNGNNCFDLFFLEYLANILSVNKSETFEQHAFLLVFKRGFR